jgi:hypothetical protein
MIMLCVNFNFRYRDESFLVGCHLQAYTSIFKTRRKRCKTIERKEMQIFINHGSNVYRQRHLSQTFPKHADKVG